MHKTATYLLLLLMAGAAWHMIHYYPLLPDTVASHFDGSGEPDGWSSKQTFVTLYAALVALLGGTFLGLAVFLPKIPDSLINMPHRDYWLAPERRRESLAAVTACMLWLGCATIAFTMAIMQLTFEVNLGQRPALGDEFWWLMGFCALAVVGSVAWMLVRFRKPPRAAA